MIMINLFSSFDPSTSINFSINWFRSIYVLLFIPSIYWLVPSRWNFCLIYFFQILIKDFSVLLNLRKNLINILIFIRLFIIIYLNNFLGLFSYIFVSSRHFTFGLTFSLTLWLSFILYGWITNTNHIFTHLVPVGTPLLIGVFMVLIETIRNFIRFGSLAIRLAANILAGHVIITLLASLVSQGILATLFVLFTQLILLVFELGVTFIQAYVFTLLTVLYRIELS